MKKTVLSIIALVSLGAALSAVETKTWLHSSRQSFAKGSLHNLSLSVDGRLFLAPRTEELMDTSSAVLWAVARDARGNVYVGGGGPGAATAKLFRITPAGETSTLAELEALSIQAIAVSASGEVFAATSPDGAVYRIHEGGDPEVFYKPGEKYIWAMAFNSAGELFVATGDAGNIYRVSSTGAGKLFFESEETHVRSLIIDKDDNLVVGTEPSGLIMRISPAGEGFVLHQSAKREVTAVAVAADGSIYAAAIGNKKPPISIPRPTSVIPTARPPATTSAAHSPGTTTVAGTQRPRAATPPLLTLRRKVTGGSEIYRIEPDGNPRTVWSDRTEIVYCLAFDGEGRIVFGTGNEGRIYRLGDGDRSTMLRKLAPSQVTALVSGRSGELYAVTSNIGKLYRLGPESEREGYYESAVLDARRFSYWGRLRLRAEIAGGSVGVETRSGNLDRPQRNWSPWAPVALASESGRVTAPPARFLQYKVTLQSAPGGESPVLNRVDVAYMNKNVTPVVKKIAATPPNYRFPPQTLTLTKKRGLTLSPLTATKRPAPKPMKISASLSMQYAKGEIGARWLATDANGDNLAYKVEIRGVNETEWKLLKKDLKKAHLSWDSTAFADGEYRLRITASDAPSNPPSGALTATREGEPFLIDNTPPAIDDLTASAAGGKATIKWAARDANTVITKAEYSLDGGEWTVVEPVTKLSDAKQLDYDLAIDAAPGEHTVAIRVKDEFENQSVAKVVFK